MFNSDIFKSFANKVQYNPSSSDKIYKYGTAGFRDNEKELDRIFFIVGAVSALRSMSLCSESTTFVTGVMITASHNPIEDNGVKMVDPDGSMLSAKWEEFVEECVNISDTNLLLNKLQTNVYNTPSIGHVYIGIDTRPHSIRLAKAVEDGVKSVGSFSSILGKMTTPILHHIIRFTNGYGSGVEYASFDGYHSFLKKYMPIIPHLSESLIIDVAGGVGYESLTNSPLSILNHIGNPEIINTSLSQLNHMCGAEYCQKQLLPPTNKTSVTNKRIASFDGDGDRLVYSFFDNSGKWRLLDGDRIAILYCKYICDFIKNKDFNFSIGLVQTAYANGGSTKYIIQDLGEVEIALAKTGVKYVEAVAHEYDVGIYFEANGHGTVLVKQCVFDFLEDRRDEYLKLLNFFRILNQAVGDAISDMLGVEYILNEYNWSHLDWFNMYTDLPSKQSKVIVNNRSDIQCSLDETKVIEPSNMQNMIHLAYSKYEGGRAFVRPSGTEDAVRIYAEANNMADAKLLAFEVANIVVNLVGGTPPSKADYE